MDKRTSYLIEASTFSEAQLDAAQYIAKGVTLIKPGFSTNVDKAGRARYYSPEVLKQSIGVFEGTRSFRNHPSKTEKADRPERDVRDITGYYTDVMQAADGSLKGNYHVVGEARTWLWPMIEETVNGKTDLLATSINALGETTIGKVQDRDAVIVEAIKHSNSVDVVTTAGAGGSFAGALLHDNGDEFTAQLLAALSFEEWREARPDFLDKLKNELKTARNDAALKEVKDQNEALIKQIADLTEAHRAEADELAKLRRVELADRLLSESTLPNKLRDEVKQDLLTEADEDAMRKVIEREAKKFAAAPKPRVEVQSNGNRKPIQTGAPAVKTSITEAAVDLLHAADVFRALPGESLEAYQRRRAAQPNI